MIRIKEIIIIIIIIIKIIIVIIIIAFLDFPDFLYSHARGLFFLSARAMKNEIKLLKIISLGFFYVLNY